jgi:hypothetical protein
MNIEQAKQALEELVKITNVDSNEFVNLDEPHKEADWILCELINEYVPNGKELTNLFKNIDKWYA